MSINKSKRICEECPNGIKYQPPFVFSFSAAKSRETVEQRDIQRKEMLKDSMFVCVCVRFFGIYFSLTLKYAG